MTRKNDDERRKILKTTLAGGAVITTSILPEKWEKPSMDSIVLPAHAGLTCNVNCNITG